METPIVPHPRRRSVFADRLGKYADFAFGDEAVYAHRGTWATFLRERIGPTFNGRVVFEIGSADGDLICRLAAKQPATAFIGLDWKARSVFAAAEHVARLGLQNVVLLRGRGQEIAQIFGPGEIDEVLLFHPDPCAAEAERPNRLFHPPFLLAAHEVLRGNAATFTLKTDHPGYYAWALALLGQPEPPHFAAARARATADPTQAHRLHGEPRVRASDLPDLATQPAACAELIQRFDVTMSSADFWNDAPAQSHIAGRVFAGEQTEFEQRFLRKKQPIYYLEFRKH